MPHAAQPAAVAAPTFTYGASPLLLRRAIQHDGVGDLGLARVFRRLHGGHAVRMMAFGTSITAISGGCTHSLLPYCPMCCGTRDYCGKSHERCLASSNNTVGFLRRTLEWMNETWPHPGHRLYNGGRPGAGGLANFLGCLSTWVPEEIDLFWFEVGGTGNNIAMVERLARQLYGFRPPAERPAIVALDFWNTRGLKPRSSSKASPTPGNEIGSLDTGAFMNSGAVLPLARFYGWTVISEHDAFFHAFNTEELNPQHLKPDGVHPHGKAVALYGDLVLAAMWAAHEGWRALGPHGAAELRDELTRRPLPAPLAAPADAERSLACFTFDQPRFTGARESGSASHIVDAEGGLAPVIERNTGWEFIANESRSARANKPGLQATEAGAELELRVLPVTTTVAGQPKGFQLDVRGNVTVGVRYLTSYEGMGAAELRCADGCSCATRTLTAHQPKRRESVDRVEEVAVALDGGGGGARCAVALRTVDLSAAGGASRFKLTRLTVAEHFSPR